MFKARATLKVTPEELLAAMYSLQFVGRFDPTLIYGRVLHHFADGRTIVTHSANKNAVMTPRDFVDIISYKKLADGSYVFVDVGVPNALQHCPGCIRGAVVMFAYHLKPVADKPEGAAKWTEATLLSQVLIGGWIPPALTNRFVLPCVASVRL